MGSAMTIVTGGAAGADAHWESEAHKRGLAVDICTFKGHCRAASETARLVFPSRKRRKDLWKDVQAAAQRRHHRLLDARDSVAGQLMQRDGLLATHSRALLVVTERPPEYRSWTRKVPRWDCMVHGSSGWVVQMFVDRHVKDRRQPALAVFAQDTAQWYVARLDFEWQAVRWWSVACPVRGMRTLPTPPVNVGAVGCHKLQDAGRTAIASVLDRMIGLTVVALA